MDKKKADYLIKKYKELGFSRWQLHEIYLGLLKDLDVSVYAKRKYRAAQMREIRLAQEMDIDILEFTTGYPQVSEMRRKRKKAAKAVMEDLAH